MQNLDGPKAKYCFHLLGIYVGLYLPRCTLHFKNVLNGNPQFIEDAISYFLIILLWAHMGLVAVLFPCLQFDGRYQRSLATY